MKSILMIMAILCGAIQLQSQEISLGAGFLEESMFLGMGAAVQAGIGHDVHRNINITGTYTHAFLQTGDARLISGDKLLTQHPEGSTFNQAQLIASYKVYTNDERLAIQLGAGASYQFNDELYPSAKLDIIPFPMERVHPYFSWSPVMRGQFDEGDGWSHTITMGLAYRF